MIHEKFEFSQASLQDYVDCHRRFQLKYIDRQPWPAVEVEPALEHEVFSQQGQQFHRMMERYFSGVPEEYLEGLLNTGELQAWWRAFKSDPPLNLPQQVVMPEVRLSAGVAGYRLVGVFDLVAIDLGRRFVIVDWKTGRYRPPRDVIAARLQSRVYPYLAVKAGSYLFGEMVDPARVTMLYWFANHAGEPHVFHYNLVAHVSNARFLEALVSEIAGQVGDVGVTWPLTVDEGLCVYCVYRSLCGRGVSAGLVELDALVLDDELFDLGLEGVDEYAY